MTKENEMTRRANFIFSLNTKIIKEIKNHYGQEAINKALDKKLVINLPTEITRFSSHLADAMEQARGE